MPDRRLLNSLSLLPYQLVCDSNPMSSIHHHELHHDFGFADLILLLEIHSSILRSAGCVVFWDDFRTIYYTIFRLKPPICRPLRFVEQAIDSIFLTRHCFGE